jgi:hypothetical protein
MQPSTRSGKWFRANGAHRRASSSPATSPSVSCPAQHSEPTAESTPAWRPGDPTSGTPANAARTGPGNLGQVQLALIGGDFGDLAAPLLVWAWPHCSCDAAGLVYPADPGLTLACFVHRGHGARLRGRATRCQADRASYGLSPAGCLKYHGLARAQSMVRRIPHGPGGCLDVVDDGLEVRTKRRTDGHNDEVIVGEGRRNQLWREAARPLRWWIPAR